MLNIMFSAAMKRRLQKSKHYADNNMENLFEMFIEFKMVDIHEINSNYDFGPL